MELDINNLEDMIELIMSTESIESLRRTAISLLKLRKSSNTLNSLKDQMIEVQKLEIQLLKERLNVR